MPPRGSCPTDGVPTEEEVLLPDHGIVTTFCVVNLQFHPAAPPAPYVCAQVLLDGADTPLFGLVAGVPADEVRMGMKVKAEWKPHEEWTTNLMNIKWFQPTGELDAAYETYRSTSRCATSRSLGSRNRSTSSPTRITTKSRCSCPSSPTWWSSRASARRRSGSRARGAVTI